MIRSLFRRVVPAAGLLRAEASLRLLEVFAPQRPALALLGPAPDAAADAADDGDDAALWFAVPKSRISKGKKRIKNANAAPRPISHFQPSEFSGEPTLRHTLRRGELEAAAEKVRAAKAAAAAPPAPALEDGAGDGDARPQ